MTPRRVSRAEAIGTVVELARRRAGQTAFVGVDGFGGSGKSTLAADIAAAAREDVLVVHGDDFARPTTSGWEWDRLQRQVVDPLLAERPGHYQRWDWPSDSGGEWHDVPCGRLVVIEGVSATRRELRVPWSLRIWVTAPREIRLARAEERDGTAMLPRWLEHWMPEEEAYAVEQQPLQWIDLIVDGTS